MSRRSAQSRPSVTIIRSSLDDNYRLIGTNYELPPGRVNLTDEFGYQSLLKRGFQLSATVRMMFDALFIISGIELVGYYDGVFVVLVSDLDDQHERIVREQAFRHICTVTIKGRPPVRLVSDAEQSVRYSHRIRRTDRRLASEYRRHTSLS